ncbi:MAG TPA: sigma 54-interacting transcriptional regulator [Kofleriaceae bacterium]|nr:sigma 54-interacting transcriptional regulator [Kofleriaceae bacterium]
MPPSMNTISEPTVDGTAATPSPARLPARMFLSIAGAPDQPARLVPIEDGQEVTFGRSRGATISVDHEKVSRMHARLRRDGDALTVEDLGSRNGTRVNGERIEAATTVVAGDEIGLGPLTIVVNRQSRARRVQRGVADHATLEQRLAAELDRAMRYRRPVALAMVRLTGADAAVDAAAERLVDAVRPMDLVAEFGGSELAVLLPELSRADAMRELDRLAGEAHDVGATATWAVAVAPEDGQERDLLIAAARDGLRSSRRGRPAGAAADGGGDLVIADATMRRIYQLVDRIATTGLTVLILGETGVGKEVVAEAIHRRSGRAAGPLVKLNCAAVAESLLEAELFGHEKGAFTGADRRRIGYFEAASGGTLFLDEIGEMPSELQAKLLRVLERKAVTRIGGTAEVPVDVRVVVATHRDLDADSKSGRFRQDLYYRIAGFTLVVPPLRDRKAEIVPLAEQFAARFAAELGVPTPAITDAAQAALVAYDWPGNIRELKNAIDRALVLAGDGPITPVELPDKVFAVAREDEPAAAEPGARGVRSKLAEVERTAIAAALDECGGNQTHAARKLGLSRRALIYKMERYGFKPPPVSAELARKPKP